MYYDHNLDYEFVSVTYRENNWFVRAMKTTTLTLTLNLWSVKVYFLLHLILYRLIPQRPSHAR